MNKYDTYIEQPPVPTKAKWQVALYIRLSREDGDKGESNSIKSQREILLEYVNSDPDLETYDIYIDDGWSGTNFERPSFQRMMVDIEAKKVNCVIVKDLSRLGRNYTESGKYIDEIFPRNNVRFIALNNNIDSFAENANAFVNCISTGITNVINESVAATASVNIKGTLDINRKQGKFIGSFASYGYKKDPDDYHKLIIDDEAADVVRMIYDKFLDGMSILRITKDLNRLGVLNPSSYKRSKGLNYHHTSSAYNDSLWCDQTVRRILSNQIYIGNMVQHKNASISYKIKQCRAVPREEWIIVEGTHEAIIDRSKFDKVQELLKQRTKISQKSGELDLFAGFLKCADCGRAMSKKTNKSGRKTYVYYRCVTSRKMDKGACTTHSVRADILEEAVLKSIQSIIEIAVDFDKLNKELEKIKKAEKGELPHEKLILKNSDELEKMKNIQFGLYSDWKNGEITKDEYNSFKIEIARKISELEATIAEVEKDNKKIEFKTENEFINQFKKHNNITKLTRPILTELVDSILIHEDNRITINFKFSDAFAEFKEKQQKEQQKRKLPDIA